jgi:hypothetical protein
MNAGMHSSFATNALRLQNSSMSQSKHAARPTHGRARKKRRFKLSALWPTARERRRLWQRFKQLPRVVQIGGTIVLALAIWLVLNWTYQVIRKPSELFFPVSGSLHKVPPETWREYAPIFRRHATAVMTPDLLAAIAQVEGSGNPVVRTYWRWSFETSPFEIYRPHRAQSAYQITTGTCRGRRYRIHDCVVVGMGRGTPGPAGSPVHTRTIRHMPWR